MHKNIVILSQRQHATYTLKHGTMPRATCTCEHTHSHPAADPSHPPAPPGSGAEPSVLPSLPLDPQHMLPSPETQKAQQGWKVNSGVCTYVSAFCTIHHASSCCQYGGKGMYTKLCRVGINWPYTLVYGNAKLPYTYICTMCTTDVKCVSYTYHCISFSLLDSAQNLFQIVQHLLLLFRLLLVQLLLP